MWPGGQPDRAHECRQEGSSAWTRPDDGSLSESGDTAAFGALLMIYLGLRQSEVAARVKRDIELLLGPCEATVSTRRRARNLSPQSARSRARDAGAGGRRNRRLCCQSAGPWVPCDDRSPLRQSAADRSKRSPGESVPSSSAEVESLCGPPPPPSCTVIGILIEETEFIGVQTGLSLSPGNRERLSC